MIDVLDVIKNPSQVIVACFSCVTNLVLGWLLRCSTSIFPSPCQYFFFGSGSSHIFMYLVILVSVEFFFTFFFFVL